MKVLLVEDEKLIRQFIVEYFQKQGEEVIEASDGYEGLSLLDDSFDLVLLDIKGTNKKNYEEMTHGNFDNAIKFIKLCEKLNKKLWLRVVIVPGINDTKEYIYELVKFIKPIKNVEKIEFLPYHTLGVHKYEDLKITYPLKGVHDMDKDKCKKLENMLKEELKR